MFYKIEDLIGHSCEESMIAHAALVLKEQDKSSDIEQQPPFSDCKYSNTLPFDPFAQRFASIQAILDSVEFLENYEVILAKYSSSCYCHRCEKNPLL